MDSNYVATKTELTFEEGMVHCLTMIGVACTLLDSMCVEAGIHPGTNDFILSSRDACVVLFNHIHTGLHASGCGDKIPEVRVVERVCNVMKTLDGFTALNSSDIDAYVARYKQKYEAKNG